MGTCSCNFSALNDNNTNYNLSRLNNNKTPFISKSMNIQFGGTENLAEQSRMMLLEKGKSVTESNKFKEEIKKFSKENEESKNEKIKSDKEEKRIKESKLNLEEKIDNIKSDNKLVNIKKEEDKKEKELKQSKDEENIQQINELKNSRERQLDILKNNSDNQLIQSAKIYEENIEKQDIKNQKIENENENIKEVYLQKEKELKEKENNILMRERNLKEGEKKLEEQENEINDKSYKLILKSNEIKSKEIQLNKKYEELELKRKKDEEEYNKKAQLLIKKEKELKEKEDDLSWYNKGILVGLNNIGATCYMNATLQCLSNTKKLTEYFLRSYAINSNNVMANEYYKVLQNLWDKNNHNKAYSPNSFKEVLSKENPLFAGIQANDSKDLINFLIERFHQELNIIKKNPNINNILSQADQTSEQLMLKVFLDEFSQNFNSPISNLFYGILETKSQCQGCNIIKFNFQIYSFLEFPLQQVNQFCFNNGTKPLFTIDGKNPDVDLYECFDYNRKTDLMNGDNQMYCNICNKLNNSFYSSIIYSLPLYLIINLNRGKGAVYECKVNFPEQLNLLNYVSFKNGVTTYGLYGVICHLGPSSMSGHFVAYCRNRIDNKWYLYNDGIVTLCTRPQQYNDGMPYILFYQAFTVE